MGKKLNVALLSGGKSGEREVSLRGGDIVFNAMNPEKYSLRRYDPATDLKKLAQEADGIDVALLILHGKFGEDGTVQGFLDLLGIPYQGSGVLGSAMAMDKAVAKLLYREAGLTVADWVMATPEDGESAARLLECISLPLVVKPVRQGSSLGMSIAATRSELEQGIQEAFLHDSEVMVEQYIKGREITGGVIGNSSLEALHLVEIIPGDKFDFFDYQAKYQLGATREVCPAELDPETTAKAQAIAIAAHKALKLRGYSRTDMIVAESGGLYVLETNTIPGMTPTSLLPQSAAAHGLPFSALLDRLIELALEK